MRAVEDEEARGVALLRSGDLGGLEVLVRIHEVKAMRVAYNICGNRQIAEDIVADAFLAVHQHISTIDSQRPFLPWFYRIVINTARSAMRRRDREWMVADSRALLEEQVDPSPIPEMEVVGHEQLESLLRLVDALPRKQREVIVLRYCLDMDERSMSTVLGVPVGTVKWRLHEARRKLRAQLGEPADVSSREWREREAP